MNVPPSTNVYLFQRASLAPASVCVESEMQRRTSLWELPPGCHCPIVGTCLPIDRLRQLLDELFEGSSGLCDFELHAGVVRECSSRNKVSERLQQELDLRHKAAIDRLERASAEADLLGCWIDATGHGEAAGALWAIVTHRLCSIDLQERLLRDLHMIQHRALAAIHAERGACERLVAENVALHRALEQAAGQAGKAAAAKTESPVAPRRASRARRQLSWSAVLTKMLAPMRSALR